MKSLFLIAILFSAKAVFSQIAVTPIVNTPTCFDTPTGSLIINLSGGTAPYNIYITNSQSDTINNSTNVANNIYGGQHYYYSVVDANGFSLYDSVFVSQPLPISFNSVTTEPNLTPDQGII
jgi:hypothetical protein